MQKKLHCFSHHKFSFPYTKPAHTFPYPHHDFPSLSCSTALHFPSLSSKTNTIILPHNIKTPNSPPPPPPPPQIHPPPPKPNDDFQHKMLYLDSIGIDVFSSPDRHRQIIFSASLTDIQSTVDLLSSMNFTSLDFRRIVSICPEILASSAASILPVFTFLLREAGVNGSDLRRVINRRPRLLLSSVKQRLRPTLYFIQSIGIEEVNKHTYLLSCSVEDKLIPRIQYFEKIGFEYKEAVSMFRRFPPLFNYSVNDNFEPKLNYFVVEMGRDLKELREFPQYFSFSLENRIKPRHQCCVERGLYFPLRGLLKTTDDQFYSRLDVCCNSSMPSSNSPLFCINSCDSDDYSSNTS
ncbi:transcription termination factor MTEF1, chloroplastic [Mercurialis annua]|uniref:transcription termination factor MTEF1, chloroplastic n=1 Tax=Mercurialis annua TaxID=3986 RepID=UPI00215E7DEB|nr:transcription termination factor MTEF1, chloroplastic [Mercurialis annua]